MSLGITWMIKYLMEMDEFNADKLSNEQLAIFFSFLENPDYIRFFVWLNEQSEVELSFESAPKFFGKFEIKTNLLRQR